MTEYNSYPKDMTEMTEDNWNDFFTYCIEGLESRQAYENPKEIHEDLRIFWIRKEKNLGFCIGRMFEHHKPVIRYYSIGSTECWKEFKCNFAAQFIGDNS